jgi:hypothetical protein
MKVQALVSSFIGAVVCIGAVSGGLQQFAAPPQVPERPLELTPSEIEIYKGAQTLIDWTPSQIHDSPFLRKLRPTGSQDQLPMVLERVGQTVTLLFHDFPRIACDEVVSVPHAEQGVSFSVGGVFMPQMSETTEHRKLRYIVMPSPVGDFPAFEEYRTELDGNPLDASSLSGLSMISSKYTSTCLYFSPADQRDDRYRHFGIQTIRKRECRVVGFAQNPERARRVTRFHSQGETAGLLFQGLAWIDSETSQILQITTWLLAPRKDIGISSQTSTVDFYPVQPSGSERVLWLPRDVTDVLVFRGKQVRNTHHYSNFKLFRVDSTIKPVE